MTKAEKKRLITVIRATEYLFLENIALKLVLEHRAVANWQKLLERLLSDKEMLAGVRLKFRDLYDQMRSQTTRPPPSKRFWKNFQRPRRHNRALQSYCAQAASPSPLFKSAASNR
jgi:hypothetical protein